MPKYNLPNINTNLSNKKFLSISKAAKLLQVSPDTLRNWERQGKLIPTRTSGGARRYSGFELLALKKEINPFSVRHKGLLNVSQAAEELAVSADTLRNWTKRGLIDSQRTKGGARRFTRLEIKRVQDELGIEPKPVTPVTLKNTKFQPEIHKFSIPWKIISSSTLIVLILIIGLALKQNIDSYGKKLGEVSALVEKLAKSIESLQSGVYGIQTEMIPTPTPAPLVLPASISLIQSASAPLTLDKGIIGCSACLTRSLNYLSSLESSDGSLNVSTVDKVVKISVETNHTNNWSVSQVFGGGAIFNGGNVGIGTTSPAYQLHATGNVGIGGSITFTAADSGLFSISNNNIHINAGTGTVIIGGGAGKLDAGTVDPPYIIDGVRYATYLPSMIGVKEETTGSIKLTRNASGQFQYVIDFSAQESGSDLWLFKQVTDWGRAMKDLVVLLSSSNNAKVWYQKDSSNNRLIIFGNCSCEVSYRLTAPRFDYLSWSNIHTDQSGGGFSSNGINNTYVTSDSAQLETEQNDPFSQISFDSEGNLVIPKLRVGSLILDSSLATASAQLSVNGDQLALNTDPNYTDISPQISTNTNTYYDLSGKIASLEDRIAELETRVQGTGYAEATPSAEIAGISSEASDSADLADNLTPPDILLATGSATLANIKLTDTLSSDKLLIASDSKISGELKVFGKTTLGETFIAGNLTVDGTLSIENGSEINVLGILYLQKSPLAQGLDILNGKVSIDKEGNLRAQSVTVAEFRVVKNKIAGNAKIISGAKSVEIENSLIKPSSIILVTPTTETSLVLAVTDKVEGKKFTVSSPHDAQKDITFNYFLINESEDDIVN